MNIKTFVCKNFFPFLAWDKLQAHCAGKDGSNHASNHKKSETAAKWQYFDFTFQFIRFKIIQFHKNMNLLCSYLYFTINVINKINI